jgi:hypothetical protein
MDEKKKKWNIYINGEDHIKNKKWGGGVSRNVWMETGIKWTTQAGRDAIAVAKRVFKTGRGG